MVNLCQYKFIFGKEGAGIHSYRLFGLAIVDVVGTVIGAVLLASIFNWNYIITIVIAFLIGILFHRLFCVNTTVNKMIFGKV